MAQPATETSVSAALAIFVKTSGYSPVKTRLAAHIGQANAETFHRLSAAAVAAVARAAMPALSPCWAVAERDALGDPMWADLPALWQGEGDLGSRLHQICARLQEQHEQVLLVGADAPQIHVGLLQAALDALRNQRTPFALGRAEDGGFWLFGTRQPVSLSVWQKPRYSAASTAAELIDALAPAGGVACLPRLNDVDDGHDLLQLVETLQTLEDPLPEQRSLLAWLQRLPATITENKGCA